MKSVLLLAALLFGVPALAHVGQHPSVHDTTANIIERIRKTVPQKDVIKWKARDAEAFMTAEEKEILGSEHIRFTVNTPVKLYVIRDTSVEEPWWLKARGFVRAGQVWTNGTLKLAAFEKEFPAGSIGLGVNSLTGSGAHFIVALRPADSSTQLAITDMYPGQLRVGTLDDDVAPYVDRDDKLGKIPEFLKKLTLIKTRYLARNDGKLIDLFRLTEHPATEKPDQIILTWSDDPKTTQTIQWRTSAKIKRGEVLFRKRSELSSLRPVGGRATRVKAETKPLLTPMLLNDPAVSRHSATLRGLEPDTTYVYTVGDGKNWSEDAEFTTAPAGVKPFSFGYMGDAQNGLDFWGSLIKTAYRERPDAAFYIMAGDLVNRGADRDDWDSLFHNATGVYDRRTLVPVLGNHEYQGGKPTLYLDQFTLMTNGPTTIDKEKAYAFEYSNALFVVLDSNLPPASQTNWLEQVLSSTKATWKFVTYHHPAYSSGPKRDNKSVRDLWTPIFDRYHVDMALQGHDHAYLRTYPMLGQKRAGSTAQGTVYIVSVSGSKYYEQDKRDYTEFGMTNVSTYQILDIQVSGDRLVYRAYDADGKLRDELVIEKKPKK